jgi:hypothetical protein
MNNNNNNNKKEEEKVTICLLELCQVEFCVARRSFLAELRV